MRCRRWAWGAIAWLGLWGPMRAEAGTVAVLPFVSGSESEPHRGLGRALAALIVTDLVGVPGLSVVERERVEELLREHELVERGFVDPRQAAAAGKGLGAEALIVGEFTVVGPKLVVSARVIDVATGLVKVSADVVGPTEEFVGLEDALLAKLVPLLGAKGKAKGGRLTGDWRALLEVGEGLDAEALGDATQAEAAWKEAVAADPGLKALVVSREAVASSVAKIRDQEALSAVEAQRGAARAALRALTSEKSRPKGFVHDKTSRAEAAVRWLALENLGRPCEKAEEMGAFWAREHGNLGRSAYDNRELHGLLARFGFSKVPEGPGVPWGMTRPAEDRSGELLDGPSTFLVDGDQWPSGQRSGWLHALRACGDPARTAAVVASLGPALEGQRLLGLPGPVAARVLGLWLEGREVGASPGWKTGVDKLLADHPADHPDHRTILSVVDELGRAAARYEDERRTRRGRSAPDIVARARRLVTGTAPWSDAEPLCRALRAHIGPTLADPLAELGESVGEEERWPMHPLDRLSAAVALTEDFGCDQTVPGRYTSAKAAIDAWSGALQRSRVPAKECASAKDVSQGLLGLRDHTIAMGPEGQANQLWGSWGNVYYRIGVKFGCVEEGRP